MTDIELYDGFIRVGMKFLWEPFNPAITEHVKVVDVKQNEDHEIWIATQAWVSTSKVSGDYSGEIYWNEEGRFREAVLPLPTNS